MARADDAPAAFGLALAEGVPGSTVVTRGGYADSMVGQAGCQLEGWRVAAAAALPARSARRAVRSTTAAAFRVRTVQEDHTVRGVELGGLLRVTGAGGPAPLVGADPVGSVQQGVAMVLGRLDAIRTCQPE